MSVRLRRSLLALCVFILAGVGAAVGGHVTTKLTPTALIFVAILIIGGLAALLLDRLSGKDVVDEQSATHERKATGGAPQISEPLPPAEALPWSLVVRDFPRVLEIADSRSPKGFSGPLLGLLAAFNSNDVPEILLNTDVVRRFLGGHVAEKAVRQLYGEVVSANCLATRDQLHGALRVIEGLELASHNKQDRVHSVSMKILVQQAIRDLVGYEGMQRAYRAAADALIEAWPDVEQYSPLMRSIRQNAATVIEQADETLREPSLHPVYFRLGRSLEYCGHIHDALDYWTRLRDRYALRGELQNPDALTIRWELAYCQGQLGEIEAAIAGLRNVLADLRKIGDQDQHNDLSHRTELVLRRYLCWWRGEKRDPLGAVKDLAKLLDDDQRVLGPDDIETLTVRYNLGRWIGQSGKPTEAIRRLETLLDDCQRILGYEAPLSLAIRHDLAWWHGESGDSGRAVREYEKLLLSRNQILGSNHIHTLATRHDLAWWRWATGDRGGALKELKAVCADYTTVFTPDHPHTLAAYADLDYLRSGGEHQLTHGRIRKDPGRVPGDLPGLDFLQSGEIRSMQPDTADVPSSHTPQHVTPLYLRHNPSPFQSQQTTVSSPSSLAAIAARWARIFPVVLRDDREELSRTFIRRDLKRPPRQGARRP
jgi:tetratricopeptide (TPR) repeat protein